MTTIEFGQVSESIRRKMHFNNGKSFIESISWKMKISSEVSLSIGPWNNCLYLNFIKEDFQDIVYPKIVPCDWGLIKQRFEYSEFSLADLDWHGGITFYQEHRNLETLRTWVKVGCDYRHYGDEFFQNSDCGKYILEGDGRRLAIEFLKKFGVP